jgi:RNA polymerase sigma-70 factor, ECF subfamily
VSEGALAMEDRWPEAAPAGAPGGTGGEAPDTELVSGCQHGDEAAFRLLLHRYRGRALFLAAQILRDHAEAEDVVQEAFLKVFHAIRDFRGQSSFYSWLYRIVVNLCMDRTRRASSRQTVPLDEEWDTHYSGTGGDTRLQVEALLARLSPEMRATLLLREVVGLSYDEIARELDVPIGTVRSRLNAAREQFRRLWVEAEAGEEEAG